MNKVSGEKLKELREKNGYSLQQIVDITACSLSTVRRWEREDALVDLNIIIKLSELYGVTINDLLDTPLPKESFSNDPGDFLTYKEKTHLSYGQLALISFLGGLFVTQIFFWLRIGVILLCSTDPDYTFTQIIDKFHWARYSFDIACHAVSILIFFICLKMFFHTIHQPKSYLKTFKRSLSLSALLTQTTLLVIMLVIQAFTQDPMDHTFVIINWKEIFLLTLATTTVSVIISLFVHFFYKKHKKT